MFGKFNIVCGHYGSGKTNFALNLAFDLNKRGEKVTIVDLDVVNPYFRTADYIDELKKKGIRVIAPMSAGTNVDAPSLPGEINSVFNDDGCVILDVGGEDDGATVLGRYADKIKNLDYKMFYVINKYRKNISDPYDAVKLMRDIEYASKLKVTDIVNNSHISHFTEPETILNSIAYAEKVSEISEIPLSITTIPKKYKTELSGKIVNKYIIDVIVKLPWADKNS